MNAQYSHLSVFERCRIFDWYHYQKNQFVRLGVYFVAHIRLSTER
jgi:hypothetical protein